MGTLSITSHWTKSLEKIIFKILILFISWLLNVRLITFLPQCTFNYFFIIRQCRCLNLICKMPSVSSPTLIHVLSIRVLFSRYFLLAEWVGRNICKVSDFSPTSLKSVSFTQHVSSYTVVVIQLLAKTSSTQKTTMLGILLEIKVSIIATVQYLHSTLHQESPIELYTAITKSARLY
jgi:hypothetical protein